MTGDDGEKLGMSGLMLNLLRTDGRVQALLRTPAPHGAQRSLPPDRLHGVMEAHQTASLSVTGTDGHTV